MSSAVYPGLPGLTFDVTRTPEWSTARFDSVSLRQYRVANATYPRYHYKLSYEFLRQGGAYTELAQLVGFFNARQGDFDSFLFTDPDDNSVTAQAIGDGDGASTLFQLVRAFGGFVEPVFDVNSAPLIYVNGVLKTLTTDYTISGAGLVTFVTAPGAGLVVSWTGSFYRRVTFAQSMAEFSKFMQNLWTLKTVELIGCKP